MSLLACKGMCGVGLGMRVGMFASVLPADCIFVCTGIG